MDRRTAPQPARPAFPAPAGMRWVGSGDVALAVPSSWADSQYGCETDPSPSVVYDAGYWTTCQDTALGRERRPASLWVLPTQGARRGFGGEAYVKARLAVPRLHARRSEPWRMGCDAGRYWYQSLVVPSAHTLFVAQAATRAAVVEMIASARRTPDNVKVPPATAGEDLAAARTALSGYDVSVHQVDGYYRAGSVVGSDPAFGTPLRRGDTVVLTVSSGLGSRQAMSDAFLSRHNVLVEPLGHLSATDRQRIAHTRAALVARLGRNPSVWESRLVLRRITAEYPRRNGVPEFRHRLAWLWLTPRTLLSSLGGPCCGPSPPGGLARGISVYDALTGSFVWGSSF